MEDYFDRVEAQLVRMAERPRFSFPWRVPAMMASAAVAVAVAAVFLLATSGRRVGSRSPSAGTALAPLAPGEPCPVSPLRRLDGLQVFGRNPVWLTLENFVDRTGAVELGAGDAPRWSEVGEIWVTSLGYRRSIVVAARRLDRPGPAREGGDSELPEPGGQLSIPAGSAAGLIGGRAGNPGALWVRSPGCYGLSVRSGDFSETIVLRAVAGPHPGSHPSR